MFIEQTLISPLVRPLRGAGTTAFFIAAASGGAISGPIPLLAHPTPVSLVPMGFVCSLAAVGIFMNLASLAPPAMVPRLTSGG